MIKKVKGINPFLLGALVFLLLSFLILIVSKRIYEIEKANESLLVKEEAWNVKKKLEISLANSVSSTELLAFLVEKGLVESDFSSLSQKILNKNPTLDALQLVEQGTIVKTFPLEGNEPVIGFDIFYDRTHRKAAETAIARKKLYFEGPFELRQGGLGLVGRLPVHKDGQFWGFAAVIIRMETLLTSLNIDSSGMSEAYIYQLAKLNGESAYPMIAFKDEPNFDAGIVHKEFFEAGDWFLYVKLRHPKYFRNTLLVLVFGVVFSGMVGVFVYQKTAEPIKLKKLVAEKTKDLKAVNQELEKRAHELAISNEELEQFAYVASHDLQEPLRMITGFLGLLEKKYTDKLDAKGMQYIQFAVNGAHSMKKIILDLLAYSRIGKEGGTSTAIPLEIVIEEVNHLLRKQIKELDAEVRYKDIPTIRVKKYQMVQVFQNIIGNALKYSKEGHPPLVQIDVESLENEWLFKIADNGIGIEREHHDKIFLIFNRLYPNGVYEGSGIGLAIVKKTIEHLGGRIWLTSEVGVGTTFYFTLPK